MNEPISLFWFRNDLRISDNPALFEACKNHSIIPIYIFDKNANIGRASKIWLYNSLNSLNIALENKLNFYYGDAKDVLSQLIESYKIKEIFCNRLYESENIKRDSEIKVYLHSLGISFNSFSGSLLWEPWEILKEDKQPYKIYTYFYKNGCLKSAEPRIPLPAPNNMILIKDLRNQTELKNLDLIEENSWSKKLQQYCDAGEALAQKKLASFLQNGINGYKENRNYPFKKNISRLSSHLHFGEISPNQIWYNVKMKYLPNSVDPDAETFLSEIGWREFSYYLLYHFPKLPSKNFQSKFDNFPWKNDENLFNAWKKGQTGYPIIDAGMRELWQTGFMHNRVRMIVGSFLIKNLLINWHAGRDWFWDCLFDADLASNSAGWQWVAGSGADAAPYFRIFNPTTQGEKFDPDGEYIRYFVPELSKLPNKFLFEPWCADENILKKAGIILGKDYPKPIIDLQYSRLRALEAFKQI